MKICSKCGNLKPLTDYYAEKRLRDGKRSSCKMCDHKIRLKREQGITPEQMRRRKKLRSKHRKTESEYSQKYRDKHRAKDLIRHAKLRAKKKGLPYDLDQYIPEIQNRLDKAICEISGVTLQITTGRGRGPMNPSLDRIIPSQGYVLKNIRIVAYALNTAMGDWGIKPVLEIARSLIESYVESKK